MADIEVHIDLAPGLAECRVIGSFAQQSTRRWMPPCSEYLAPPPNPCELALRGWREGLINTRHHHRDVKACIEWQTRRALFFRADELLAPGLGCQDYSARTGLTPSGPPSGR